MLSRLASRRFTVILLSKRTPFFSMSSRTFSKLLGGADKQSTTGSSISSNLEACKGQPFTTDGERKTDNESKCFKLTSKVDLEKLSEEEKEIYFLHKEACEKGENMYHDPATGYVVFTEVSHKQRGSCCGNACRHCPFNHENVPLSKRTTTFNSAFYF